LIPLKITVFKSINALQTIQIFKPYNTNFIFNGFGGAEHILVYLANQLPNPCLDSCLHFNGMVDYFNEK